ncbi:MAG: hypothetical protein LIP18_05330 [Planctomycetes bacterium]|nr:hypothetical protein [Planctomycetota bacterium]
MPTRGRVTALLTALFHHDNGVSLAASATDGVFQSIAPRSVRSKRERDKIIEFANALIYDGGFYPAEIYALLGIRDAATARIARTVRQLDHRLYDRPTPWEAAGRVGRSGMSGAADHWAMAPGEDEAAGVSSPGTLAYLPALAVVYALYPEDGIEAARQLAILKDDDMRAGTAARSAFSLLRRLLVGGRIDKDAWLRAAAADSLDADTEHDLRSVRVKDWHYLRGEECAMGRLERAVHLWYKGTSYQRIMEQGRTLLRSRESLAYLAAISAATYGQERLPNRGIADGAADRQVLELVNDLYDLATSEAVLSVAPEEEE